MRRLLILVAVTLCCVTPALAWNGTGHMTMAMLAYRQFTPQERAAVAKILKVHPHYASYLNKNVPEGADPDEWAFVRAATWADYVRPSGENDRVFKDRTITRFHRGEWHHLEIPYEMPDVSTTQPATRPTTAPAGSISRLYDAEGDILSVLDEMTAQLSAKQTSGEDRAVALAWIQHLIGDMHQPCHVVSLFSKQYPYPDGDRRGNEQMVRTEQGPQTLHSLWDGLLGNAIGHDAITFLADDISRDPRCDVKTMSAYTKNTTFDSWAEESYRMAVSFVYLDGRIKTAPAKEYRAKSIAATDVPGVQVGYVQTARDVARVRIALSAARLASTVRASLPKE